MVHQPGKNAFEIFKNRVNIFFRDFQQQQGMAGFNPYLVFPKNACMA